VPTSQVSIGTASLGIPVPLAYGPAHVSGNRILLYEYDDATYGPKTRLVDIALAAGEWTSLDRLWVGKKRWDTTNTALVHFHPGQDTPLTAALTALSTGGDQLIDNFYTLLPSGAPPLFLSGRAHLFLKIPPDPAAPTADVDVIGDYSTTKVRTFDASGTQTGYVFSMNPAWWTMDALLRFMIKREGLLNESLSAAEKARFDFQSFSDAAAYCDGVIAAEYNAKRFEGGVAFPTRTSLTNVLEQILLMCRCYLLEIAGKLYLYPDKPRAASIVITGSAVVPGSIEQDKRAIRGQANKITGTFLDLNSPTIATITPTGASRTSNVATLVLQARIPRAVGDGIVVRRCDDASFNSDYVLLTYVSGDGLTIRYANTGPDTTSGNGIVQDDAAFFMQRAPSLEHEMHEQAVGQVGLGLSPVPKKTALALDYGVNTYSRVMRLLEFQRTRYLGARSASWKAPWAGTLQLFWEYVDPNGVPLPSIVCGDVMTLDSTVSEEVNGDFEVLEIEAPQIGGSSQSGLLAVNVTLLQMVDEAFTDVAPAEQQLGLAYTPRGLIVNSGPANYSYKPATNPLTATDAGSSATIDIASFPMNISGMNPLTYQSAAVVALAYNTIYWVIVEDSLLQGGAASFSVVTTKAAATGRSGWMCVGSIVTPQAGYPDTVGNNDGGATAQTGARSRSYGVASTGRVLNSGGNQVFDLSFSSPQSASDNDANSYASFSTLADGAILDVQSFAAIPLQGFTALLLTVKSKITSVGSGPIVINYSLDGSTWTALRSSSAIDSSPVTNQVSLPLTQDPAKVWVEAMVPAVNVLPVNWAGTVAQDTSVGTKPWASLVRAEGSFDLSYAVCNGAIDGSGNGGLAHPLKFTNFGLSVPSGLTPVGIEFTIYRKCVGICKDVNVQTLQAGVVGGSDLSTGANWDTLDEVVPFGGPSELWGRTWAYTDVNDPAFGLYLYAVADGAYDYQTFKLMVDAVKVTVTCSGGSGTANALQVYESYLEAQW
jgi:hypothetical protein